MTDLLRKSTLLRKLPASVLAELAAEARPHHVESGALVYSRGFSADGLVCVTKGTVRLSVTGPGGAEVLVGLLGPGTWFGYFSMLTGGDRRFDARAVGPTSLLVVRRTAFEALLAREPRLYPVLIELLGNDLKQAFNFIEEMLFVPLPQRLARRLLMLADAFGEATRDGVRIAQHLSQEDLGRMLGVSRQIVSRRLTGWRKKGWVETQYGHIVLTDRAALRALAETA